MTDTDFEFDGFEWEGRGYFGCPVPAPGEKHASQTGGDPWKAWAITLAHAKQGRFDQLGNLLSIASRTADGVLLRLCLVLLADAGPSELFEPLRSHLRGRGGLIDLSLNCCEALSVRGELADVPLMLSVYVDNAEYKDASIVPVCISNMLGPSVPPNPSDHFASTSEYAEFVKRQVSLAEDRWGTNEVLLYEGELLSATFLARQVLDLLGTSQPFRFWLRRRFEAMTGIDCTDFYDDDEMIQRLSAAAIVEDFLRSREPEHFKPGVRYFFGHPIP